MRTPGKEFAKVMSRKKWQGVFYVSLFLSLIFGGLGQLGVSTSSRDLHLIESLRAQAMVAEGKIVEVRYKDPGYFCGKTCLAYIPLYEFKSSSGETRKCWGSWTGRSDQFTVGETLEVLYTLEGTTCIDPQFVSKAKKDYILGIIILGLAALAVVGSVVSFWLSRK